MKSFCSTYREEVLFTACVFGIVALSVFGRKVQLYLITKIDMLWVAVAVFLTLVSILILLFTKRRELGLSIARLFLGAGLLLFAAISILTKMLVPVEALHFLIFFCCGWLSRSVFGLVGGTVAILTISFGDEILQHYLPDRVGDFHDIAVNLLSGFAGMVMRGKK